MELRRLTKQDNDWPINMRKDTQHDQSAGKSNTMRYYFKPAGVA